jgi:hypothetical protein
MTAAASVAKKLRRSGSSMGNSIIGPRTRFKAIPRNGNKRAAKRV